MPVGCKRYVTCGIFVVALAVFSLWQLLILLATIITHNQHTIAGGDLVYGVSQQEKGISRIISMRLADICVKSMQDEKA